MIESAGRPSGDGMACGAGRSSGGEISGRVIGDVAPKSLRAIPGGLMTTHAVCIG